MTGGRGGERGAGWPKITVVTPSYNQAAYLETAMRSVLEQRYPRLEYIVMDGGSTDGSVAVIRRHAAALRHWESGKDGGQAEAIARGFAMATGDVLAWLNSDDFYLPGALARVGEFFAARPEVAWAAGGYAWVRRSGKLVCKHYAAPQDFASLLCAGQRVGQPAVFWRREAYRRAGELDTALRFCFDYDLLLRLAKLASPGRIAGVLAAYREHPATKTATLWEGVGREEEAAVRRRHGLDAVPAAERARIAAAAARGRRAAARRGMAADLLEDPGYVARRALSAVRDALLRRGSR